MAWIPAFQSSAQVDRKLLHRPKLAAGRCEAHKRRQLVQCGAIAGSAAAMKTVRRACGAATTARRASHSSQSRASGKRSVVAMRTSPTVSASEFELNQATTVRKEHGACHDASLLAQRRLDASVKPVKPVKPDVGGNLNGHVGGNRNGHWIQSHFTRFLNSKVRHHGPPGAHGSTTRSRSQPPAQSLLPVSATVS